MDQKFQKLSFAFIKWITLVIVFVFFMVCIIVYQSEKNNQLKAMEKLGYQATKITGKTLENWIKDQVSMVKIITNDSRIIEACKNPQDKSKVDLAQKFLQSIHNNYPYYENLPLVSKLSPEDSFTIKIKGKEIPIGDGQFFTDTVGGETIGKCSPDYSYIREIYNGKEYFVSEVYKSILRQNPIFVISAPVKDETGKIIGVGIISPQMDYFTDTFVKTIEVGKTGYLSFVDERYMIISNPDEKMILNVNEIEKVKPIIQKGIKNQGKTFKSNFKGEKKLYIFNKINIPEENIMYNWYLLFIQSDKEINSQSVKFLNMILILGVGFVVLYIFGMICMYKIVKEHTDELLEVNRNFKIEIEERKKVQEELEKSKNIAEKANRIKSEFLANISHEIRTPLNAVLGFSELLSSVVSGAKAKKYINSIKTSGKSLLLLINDILDLSKIEAGKMEIRYKAMNFKNVFLDIEKIFEAEIEEKSLKYISGIDKTLPKKLCFDETRLRQILLNLVGNAVKFTEKGYVKLEINQIKTEEKIDTVDLVILVEDSGIGIPKKDQKDIFESFRQREGQSNRKYGGTGLGLTICKRLIESMNGELSVESEIGEGSKFRILLKNVEIIKKEESLEKENFNIENILFEKAKILIIDDLEINRNLLYEILSKVNLEVILAKNVKEAIAIAKDDKPDIIFMDMMIPEIDDFETIKKFKKDCKTKKIPIIALSSSPKIQKKYKILNFGFSGCISKPIDIHKLFLEISHYIKYTQKENKKIENKKIIMKNIKNFPKLLEIIKAEIIPKLDKLKGAIKMNDIEEFGLRIEELGKNHNLISLTDYGKNLRRFSNDFDIENIEKQLNKFPRIIKKLKGNDEKNGKK